MAVGSSDEENAIYGRADRDPVAELAKRYGVIAASIYVWRKGFGDAGTGDLNGCAI